MAYLLLLLLGCNDHMLSSVEKRQQTIMLYPEHINFGNLTAGNQSAIENFSVINTGDADLTISSPVLFSDTSRLFRIFY